MESCEFKSSCSLYKGLLSMPITLEFLEKEYCSDNYYQCARYIVSKVNGPDRVRPDLLPKDIREARNVLN